MQIIGRMNTFGKVITLVIVLLVPIIILYAYSHQVSVKVVGENIESEKAHRLSFFNSQIQSAVDQLTKFSVIVSRDPEVKEYLSDYDTLPPLAKLQKQQRIVDMLNLQVLTSVWNSQIILHLPKQKEVITTDYFVQFDERYLEQAVPGQWNYYTNVVNGANEAYFSLIRISSNPELWIEVRFIDANIRNMLKHFNQGGDSEPIFYSPGKQAIANETSDPDLVASLVQQLGTSELGASGHLDMTAGGRKYTVNYILSDALGWYLVDYVPLQQILMPITTSRNLFYTSIALLLCVSILATTLLYRNVQRPIHMLILSVKKIRMGQYSTRLRKQPNNEFDFLFESFNKMAEQIQELIEKVHVENLRSREATLKQLQSQINPHFLYNCLFYIKNMANLNDKEAVVAMSLNLGEYYRYTTRVNNEMATVEEEIRLVVSYLTIQNLRIQRFHCEIDIPERMNGLSIPRLLLQPIVENAIVHGVEKQTGFGIIQITGEQEGRICKIIVEDNGAGMDPEALSELQSKLLLPMEDDMGCGMWNVNQRLIHLYKGGSGLRLSRSELGGMRVELVWEDDRRASD
ncbi:sensor histidine kinase [Cohnella herbarum]|uniref:Sensor histidine kinase n=1 Tax=Cohnella herbarum TaxID=2728023 RepID=A0A7Z2ZJ98_9BACL|nr:sensor histidine kinase [Cohnella herbarum]QJD81981.1 sensor histidine kinase [Cohnella herbarum]